MSTATRNLRFVLTGVDKSASKAIDGVTKKSGAMNKALKFAAGGAVTGLAGIAVAAVKTEADFSSKMNQMSAVADVPAAGLKNLSDLALKMGADTVFSAGDAADAMLELAKGGLTAAQIEAGALGATLSLAAAGGLELGAAATYMSNAMNTFDLSAKDAESVAAALAGGANASSASVESLGMALSQVGPGASTAGLSLQETVAVLSAFDNAGIKGSDAGTSLKTMLSRLVPQTEKAAGAMADLGLDFTKADGSFVSIGEVSEQLRTKMGKLTDEQRTLAMHTIFGSDATRAATVLMKEGKKGVEGYTQATSDLEAAQRVAKARMTGTAGAIEQLKGSLETAALLIGRELAPHVQTLAGEITELTNGFIEGKGPGGDLRDMLGDLRDIAVELWPSVKAVAGHTKDFIGFLADHPDAVRIVAEGLALFALHMKASALASALMGTNGPKAAAGIGAAGAAAKANTGRVNAFSTAMGGLVGTVGALALALYELERAGVDIDVGGAGAIDRAIDAVTAGDAGKLWDAVWGEGFNTGPVMTWEDRQKEAAIENYIPAPRPAGGSSQDRTGPTNPAPKTFPRNGQVAYLTLNMDSRRFATATNTANTTAVRNGATPNYVP